MGQEEPAAAGARPKLAERVVAMALNGAVHHDGPVWLVLEAYFAVAGVFRRARSGYAIAWKPPYVAVLTRAKKNYVGYFAAPPKPPPRPGPQPRYGQKVHLGECFDHPPLFQTLQCPVYGRLEPVHVLSLPLLWKPLGDWVLFIWAITSRGPIVLMCSPLDLSPVAALELYCVRSRIEWMFDVLKNLFGAFRFRFWTQKLPRHARRPKPNRHLQAPAPEHQATVGACWPAYETFVLCATIAQGLLQLIALRFGAVVWQHQTLYRRTQSRLLPSEKTVRQVLAPWLLKPLVKVPQNSLIAKIRRSEVGAEEDDHEDYRQVA